MFCKENFFCDSLNVNNDLNIIKFVYSTYVVVEMFHCKILE